jgi:hypothetical protein
LANNGGALWRWSIPIPLPLQILQIISKLFEITLLFTCPIIPKFPNSIYLNLDWAADGYQLWLATSWAGIQTINMIKSIPVFFYRK